jgi:uncharacterized protein with HEPN domain
VLRDDSEYVADMLEACDRIIVYVADMSSYQLTQDRKTLDAIVWNLQVLGEAAKHVPQAVRALAPAIPWREIAGMRDVIVHDYFGIDESVVSDAACNQVPALREALHRLLLHLRGDMPAGPDET